MITVEESPASEEWENEMKGNGQSLIDDGPIF